jgi:hypothetical protein
MVDKDMSEFAHGLRMVLGASVELQASKGICPGTWMSHA